MGKIWNSLSGYFGDKNAPDVPIVDVESTTQWQASLLNFPADDRNKKLAKFVFKLSLAAANGIVTKEQIKDLVKRYQKNDRTPVDISLLSYTLNNDFIWHLWFYHRYKTDFYIGWREWSKKPESERAEYYALFDYGIRGAKKGAPAVYEGELVEDVPEDKDRFEVVYNTFFELAKVCLGVKFKEDKDEVLIGKPEFDKHGRMSSQIIGYTDEHTVFGITINAADLSLAAYDKIPQKDRPQALMDLQQIADEIQKAVAGLSKHALQSSKTAGPRESDFDLLRKAFDAVQHEPTCRAGYADEGKAMVTQNESSDVTIAELLGFMKVSGDYVAVLEKYQELKDSDSPAPTVPAPGPTTPPAAPAPVQTQPAGPTPLSPTCQTTKSMYQGFRDKVGNLADERYPNHWDAVFGKKFADDRGRGKFGQLSYIKVSVFDLINAYIDTNRSTTLPDYLENEANRLFAEAVQQQAQS